MTDDDPQTPTALSPIAWTQDGQPRSRLYDDVYFSAEDGLAEARAVFLAGCDLPDGWRGRRRFVVGELGFGTGLNCLALIDLWSRSRPPDGRLHIFSVEAHPLVADDARRALASWPEMAALVWQCECVRAYSPAAAGTQSQAEDSSRIRRPCPHSRAIAVRPAAAGRGARPKQRRATAVA